jgi:hypothetical protein
MAASMNTPPGRKRIAIVAAISPTPPMSAQRARDLS